MRRILRRLRRAVVLAYEENCLGIAKAAAYSSLLALFPLLTLLATMLVRVQAESVTQVLARIVARVVPPDSAPLVLYAFAERGERPLFLLALGSVVTLWGASGVMMSLMEGFHRLYQVSPRPFLRHRITAALLVIATTMPVVAASALILIGARAERMLMGWLGLIPMGRQMGFGVALAGKAARFGLAFAAVVLVCCLLYRFGPNRRQRWRQVWPGAVLASVLWLFSAWAFGWYVRNIAHYNVLYGSLGAVIALLVWMYLMSVIALVGCAFNVEWEKSTTRRRAG